MTRLAAMLMLLAGQAVAAGDCGGQLAPTVPGQRAWPRVANPPPATLTPQPSVLPGPTENADERLARLEQAFSGLVKLIDEIRRQPGPRGEKGPVGDKGPTGDQGPPGEVASDEPEPEPAADDETESAFARWTASIGEALGGHAGDFWLGIITAGGASLGIPPAYRWIFARFFRERANRLGGQAGANLDARFNKWAGDLVAQVNERLEAMSRASASVEPPGKIIVRPEAVHHNQIVSVPDNREGHAYAKACKVYAEKRPESAVHLRNVEGLKNRILSGMEPTECPI